MNRSVKGSILNIFMPEESTRDGHGSSGMDTHPIIPSKRGVSVKAIFWGIFAIILSLMLGQLK